MKVCRNVNAVSGTLRTVSEIRRKWSDWCIVVKTKESKRRREANATGGGPIPTSQIGAIEEKVVGILGETAISGIKRGKYVLYLLFSNCIQLILEECPLKYRYHCLMGQFRNHVCDKAHLLYCFTAALITYF